MPTQKGQLAALILALLMVGVGGLPVLAQEAPPLTVVEPDGADQAPGPVPSVVAPSDLTVAGQDGAAAGDGSAMRILTVDQNALFTQSAWGRRLQAEFDRRGAELEAENSRLVEQLSTEEAELTELRKTLEADDFRTRADAFDARATQIRRERAQAVTDLNAQGEAEQNAFFRAAVPVMGRLMQELGAVAVLDRRSTLISVESIDITDELIARIDAELGDGSSQSQTAPDDAAQPGDPAAPEAGPATEPAPAPPNGN